MVDEKRESINESNRTNIDGQPLPPDYRELKPNGQQKDYVCLASEERAKGFVRPVRRSYIHVGMNPKMDGCVLLAVPKDACGTRTTMALALAETYAAKPDFYQGTFCCGCGKHFPVGEFMWEGTTERVGS